MNNIPNPGYPDQARKRTLFRVAGLILVAVALGFLIVGGVDFFSSFGSGAGTQPSKFWMLFVGLPLLVVGGWLLQAGYLGAAARYTAGETMPVVKDSAAYLSDGEGVLGVGRTKDDAPESNSPAAATGPFCRACGQRNDVEAKFCDACGQSLS